MSKRKQPAGIIGQKDLDTESNAYGIQVYGWNVGGRFAFGYLCFTVVFIVFYLWQRSREKKGLPEELLSE